MPNIPELKSKILSFIQRNGPSIPIQISKQINENMIFTGAVLSELASTKKIFISSAKIGSSPVYYLPGQEYRLSQVLYPYLKDVYKRVHDLLKEKIILKDNELEPWQRVALRESKDFAVMLNLMDGNIFWKWHLISDNDAEIMIRKHLGISEKKEEPEDYPDDKNAVEDKVQEITGIKPRERFTEKKAGERQQLLKKEIDLGSLENFFNEKQISILDRKQLDRKEANFMGEIGSGIGTMKVFIKFKDKKKISDSDLITAHNESGKMPLYFISSGDLTKKAQKYMEENFLVFEKFK